MLTNQEISDRFVTIRKGLADMQSLPVPRDNKTMEQYEEAKEKVVGEMSMAGLDLLENLLVNISTIASKT